MSLYMAHSTYSSDSWANLIGSHEDRRGAIAQAASSAGCSLQHIWFSLAAPHSYVVFEGDLLSMGAFKAAVAASGAVTSIELNELITPEEMVTILHRAASVKFTAP